MAESAWIRLQNYIIEFFYIKVNLIFQFELCSAMGKLTVKTVPWPYSLCTSI